MGTRLYLKYLAGRSDVSGVFFSFLVLFFSSSFERVAVNFAQKFPAKESRSSGVRRSEIRKRNRSSATMSRTRVLRNGTIRWSG